MHKLVVLLKIICLMLALSSCIVPSIPEEPMLAEAEREALPAYLSLPELEPLLEQPFEGKVALITFCDMQGVEGYFAAKALTEKYGNHKVVHKTWPWGWGEQIEERKSLLDEIAFDQEIKAVVIRFPLHIQLFYVRILTYSIF